jgi:poly-gamma-glutamate synthesis protein (capsule biosynthesis protein)
MIYALVAPFPTVADDIPFDALKPYWQGTSVALPGFDTPPKLIVSADHMDALSTMLGKAGTTVSPVQDRAALDGTLLWTWSSRPAISIVPFDQLQPRWKVLAIDGKSPLDKSLDVAAYPLTLKVGVIAGGDAGAKAVDLLKPVWQTTNRDPSRLTTVVLTGTTALTRATAWTMDRKGVNYPSEKIMPFLADADILHVSNEVSFTPKCPPADPNGDEKFCSSPKYLDLLKTIGVDIVELTGNHNLDYGTNPANYSLDQYDNAKIPYFGGGRNLQDAQTPRILTAPDGTKIAFVGCNPAGPFKAWATAQTPGAAPCGDWVRIKAAIADLKSNHKADVVIVTLQYHEDPQYAPTDSQRADFESLAAAGADIVSGSQAHQPQGFSFAGGKVIHFGVGNLFFDQMDFVENRQMFADKYVLYNGKVISLVLFTGINEDYSQPRPMTPEERAAFLKTIFQASGW